MPLHVKVFHSAGHLSNLPESPGYTYLLDGVKGRASGVIILRDGVILAGDPHFWSVGPCTPGEGTWKGDRVTNQQTPYSDGKARAIRWPGGHVRLFRNLSG